MNDISHTVGLMARQLRDVQSGVSTVNHQIRRLTEAPAYSRPAGIVARLAACAVLGRVEKRSLDDIVRLHFGDDRELAQVVKAAVDPAQTGVAGWASEIVGVIVADVAERLLPESVFAQLRARGVEYNFLEGGLVRAPTHAAAPSGAFVSEGSPIPAAQFVLGSITLRPKKAAVLCALTKELLAGSPLNVETSLRTIMAEDLGLMIDGILLGSGAATAAAPAGLLAGLSTLTPTTGGGMNALLGDIKLLLAAIAPALRPVILANAPQGASIAALAPGLAGSVIVAPFLAANTVIGVDAAAFVSSIGVPDFNVSENPAVHLESSPLPIGTVGSPPVVAAPTRSLWQTASVGLRAILPTDWAMRRANAVAFTTGTTW